MSSRNKTKINSDEHLPLEKTLITQNIIVILIKSVFNKNHNYYYNDETFLEKWSYKQYLKSYIMIELMFQKVLMLIRQVHLKSVLFVTIGIFRTKSLGFNQPSAMGFMVY